MKGIIGVKDKIIPGNPVFKVIPKSASEPGSILNKISTGEIDPQAVLQQLDPSLGEIPGIAKVELTKEVKDMLVSGEQLTGEKIAETLTNAAGADESIKEQLKQLGSKQQDKAVLAREKDLAKTQQENMKNDAYQFNKIIYLIMKTKAQIASTRSKVMKATAQFLKLIALAMAGIQTIKLIAKTVKKTTAKIKAKTKKKKAQAKKEKFKKKALKVKVPKIKASSLLKGAVAVGAGAVITSAKKNSSKATGAASGAAAKGTNALKGLKTTVG